MDVKSLTTILPKNMKLYIIVCVFLFGLYYFLISRKDKFTEGFMGMGSNCPNLLLKKDSKFYLYNTLKEYVPGVNPIEFNNLEEYSQFSSWLNASGINCPILYAQQTYDTQGNQTYKFTSSPDNEHAGLPPVSITKLYDAGHNQGSMPGFDPMNQYIGDETPLDKMFHQQQQYKKSDNPMDANFGGARYAQGVVDTGVYSGDNVYFYATDSKTNSNYRPKYNSSELQQQNSTQQTALSNDPIRTNFGGQEYARRDVVSGKYSGDEVSIYVNKE